MIVDLLETGIVKPPLDIDQKMTYTAQSCDSMIPSGGGMVNEVFALLSCKENILVFHRIFNDSKSLLLH